MTAVLLAAALAAPPDPAWRFADEPTLAGRSVVGYRTVELADKPAKPELADGTPAGARFGSIPLAAGEVRLAVVWHPASAAVWIDANGDSTFSKAERHTLGTTPLAVPVGVPFDGGEQPRTLLVRRRADGLAAGVRGHTVGTASIAGKPVKAALTDGDGDGRFDAAGTDRVWLDLDGNGTLDPLTEQFPLGTAITHTGAAFLVRPRPDGLGLTVRERPSEVGKLMVSIPRAAGATVTELAVQYVSEWGELVVVRNADQPQPVPAGRYRVEGVRLTLAAADGKVWKYTFSSGYRPEYAVTVAKGGAITHAPLAGLSARATTDPDDGVKAGESVQVNPDVRAGGLYLTSCEVGDKYADGGREVTCDVQLAGPGSATVDRFSSGFA